MQGSGQPGADAASLFIRGQGSFNTDIKHDPLVLIDDIESDITTLSRISANDIEDIAILKDAASTAIFGIKGADGVILVTTRRGKLGKPRVTLRMDYGLQRPTYKNKFLSSYDGLTLLKELHTNDQNFTDLNNEKYFSDEALEHYRLQDMPYVYPDVDWYNLLYKKSSTQQQYTADVQGGVDRVKYFVSFSYLDQGGLFKNLPKKEDFNNDYYQHRYNLRANFDIKVTDYLTAKINANAILTEINEPNMPSTRGMSDASIFRRIIGAGIAPYSYPAYQEVLHKNINNGTIHVGDKYPLDLINSTLPTTVREENKKLTYTIISGAGVISIDDENVMTAQAVGTAQVKIESKYGITNQFTINVINAPDADYTRIFWKVNTSIVYGNGQNYVTDGTTGKPEDLFDGQRNTFLSLVKPGKKMSAVYEGPPKGEINSFIVDMLSPITFKSMYWSHRAGHAYTYLRIWALSIEGSNDGQNWTMLKSEIKLPDTYGAPNVNVDKRYDIALDGQYEYRYVKVNLTNWSDNSGGATSGNTMQMSEFGLSK